MEYGDCLIIAPEDERWKALVTRCPDAMIFHHPAWLRVLSEAYHYHSFIVAIPDGQGELVAGLPVMAVESLLTRRRWVSLPFTDYCTPLAQDEAARERLTQVLVELASQEGAPRIELRWAFTHPQINNYTHFVIHLLRLGPDTEDVRRQFHRTQRQNIGTASDGGVTIQGGTGVEQLEAFYRLQLQTRRRQGVPLQPRRFFDLLQREILAQGLGFILLANQGDRCLAAGLFLHWGRTLTYKYAASSDDPDSRDLRPNHLLTWTAMTWGCEHGYTMFDFGRTENENEGLRTFKKRWGAEEIPLPYSMCGASAPEAGDGWVMQTMQRVIQNSPLWVCEMVGKALYRHFG